MDGEDNDDNGEQNLGFELADEVISYHIIMFNHHRCYRRRDSLLCEPPHGLPQGEEVRAVEGGAGAAPGHRDIDI